MASLMYTKSPQFHCLLAAAWVELLVWNKSSTDTNINDTDLSNAGDECPSDWWPRPKAAETYATIF